MMGRQSADQSQFFYAFNLDERVPETHLLRRIDVFVRQVLADIHTEMVAYYSHTGRPSIDPELLMRMLIIGYCYGIRSERKLCEEVALNLAYRWFCRLDLDDAVPNHSSFSKNRHGRFRDSDLCAGSLSASSEFAWRQASSRATAFRSMRALLKPTPAATTASPRKKSTGVRWRNRRAPCGNILMRSMKQKSRTKAARPLK